MPMDEGETLERLVRELVDAIGEAGAVMDEAMDVARAVPADDPTGTGTGTATDTTAAADASDTDTAADGVTSGS